MKLKRKKGLDKFRTVGLFHLRERRDKVKFMIGPVRIQELSSGVAISKCWGRDYLCHCI